ETGPDVERALRLLELYRPPEDTGPTGPLSQRAPGALPAGPSLAAREEGRVDDLALEMSPRLPINAQAPAPSLAVDQARAPDGTAPLSEGREALVSQPAPAETVEEQRPTAPSAASEGPPAAAVEMGPGDRGAWPWWVVPGALAWSLGRCAGDGW